MSDPIRIVSDNNNGVAPIDICNVEAEAALLGAMMTDNSVAGLVAWLDESAFYEGVHRRIYSAILRHVSDGRLATPITLRPEFIDDQDMNTLGGPAYLAQLTGSSAGLIGAKDFARQIDDLHKRRLLFEALTAGAKACHSDWHDSGVGLIVETLDEAVSSVSASLAEAATATVTKAWDAAMIRYDEIKAGNIDPGITIDGLDDFNSLIGGGMREGQLIVIAGRPGMGKTALAVTLASSSARAGHATAFFSLEMSQEELIERQIADICFIYGQSFTYEQLKRGKVADHQRMRINHVREEIADWPLTYDDTAEMKVGHLIGKLRRMKTRMASRGKTLRIAIVDYLQLLKPDSETGNDVSDLSRTTRSLKVAAKQLGITIVLLSQLNRGVEARDNKRPMLADLRGSGSIEQDADVVMFLYREEYYLENNKPEDAKKLIIWQDAYDASRDRLELIAAKVRGAKTGSRKCYFFGAHQAVRGSDFHSNGGR